MVILCVDTPNYLTLLNIKLPPHASNPRLPK